MGGAVRGCATRFECGDGDKGAHRGGGGKQARAPSPYEEKNRKNKIKIKIRAYPKNSGPNSRSFRFLGRVSLGPIAAFRPNLEVVPL